MKYSFLEPEAGSDESGKGDFFGGLHIAITFLEVEDYLKLQKENLLPKINDSKLLSDANVYYLAPKLKEILRNNIISISFGAKEYNRLYSEFKNLNILLSYAHNIVWSSLKEKLLQKNKTMPKKTIIDQFCPKEKYIQYLKNISIEVENINIFQTKAESKFLSCAISSIISRFNFLEEISELSKKLLYELPLGASNKVIESYKELSIKKGFKAEMCCKTHFKTIKKAVI
ncbi:ribonuclease HIII [Mycoplasma parvum]|uniref:Ribonuclease n=1 Tax=Mycoplasma parvum str. Indiana TaxID=1403316 RepID=U5NFI4_9MOLU|nr:ribonuclease HIII [Mycoplasma parvum]AGX88988.1 hypothetical protein PRV_01125 [Mycoplasma parvum str. Indiana]